jgi:hypothetical protein
MIMEETTREQVQELVDNYRPGRTPAKVFSLCRCEEYWMQEDLGIYATREAAIKVLEDSTEKIMLVYDEDDQTIVIAVDSGHYTDPNTDFIISRKGEKVTKENIQRYLGGGFEFYDLEHAGYAVYGIFPREVRA